MLILIALKQVKESLYRHSQISHDIEDMAISYGLDAELPDYATLGNCNIQNNDTSVLLDKRRQCGLFDRNGKHSTQLKASQKFGNDNLHHKYGSYATPRNWVIQISNLQFYSYNL